MDWHSKKKTGKGKPNLSDNQKKTIREWIDDDCQLSIEEIKSKAIKEWPQLKSISWSTIQRALNSFHYSFIVV
jgi:hypothetical protein